MSYLQRRALGGGKTPQKRAKTPSKPSSKNVSKPSSRALSRQGTDDEGFESDGTIWSFNSMDQDISQLDDITNWQDDLGDRVARINDKDRKRLAVGGLEEALTSYNKILCSKYAKEEIAFKSKDLIESFLRSIKSGKTDKEQILACSAIGITIITDPDCAEFDTLKQPLTQVIEDHESLPVKSAAIHALSAATFFTDASMTATETVMDSFLEIIESDGHSVGAGDDAGVVVAALEEWGFLLSVLDDAEEVTQRSVEAIVDQLDSTDVSVQVAAGEAIALMFEKGHHERGDDDSSGHDDEDDNGDEEPDAHEGDHDDDDGLEGEGFHHDQINRDKNEPVAKYLVYRNVAGLKKTLTDLSKHSTKSVSKRNRQKQHTSFQNVLHTIEHPLHGPSYSRALDKDGREFGSRLAIKVGRKGTVKLNSWWKLVRWHAMRRFLGGGILVHWEYNPVVFEVLPLILEAPKEHKQRGKHGDSLQVPGFD